MVNANKKLTKIRAVRLNKMKNKDEHSPKQKLVLNISNHLDVDE